MILEEREVSLQEHPTSATMLKHISGPDEENVKLSDSENIKLDGDAEIATREASPDDEESKMLAARQSDITASHETASSSKVNIESPRVMHEKKSKVSTKQVSVKTSTPKKSKSVEDLKDNEDLNECDDTQLSNKMQDDKRERTPTTMPNEKLIKKETIEENGRERLEMETGKVHKIFRLLHKLDITYIFQY